MKANNEIVSENLWQNSECCGGVWLHDFRITRSFPKGSEEVCYRCHLVKFFREDTPNAEYLSWHLRSTLQLGDPRFAREFPTTYKTIKDVYKFYGR